MSRFHKRVRSAASLLGIFLAAAGCAQQGAAPGEAVEGLKGTSASDSFKQAAQVLGRGLKQVRQGLDDAELAGKIYARILWDKQLQAAKVSIDSRPGGVVELKGTAPSDRVRERVVDLAANTIGVREVLDRIEVRPDASGAAPAVDATRSAAKRNTTSVR